MPVAEIIEARAQFLGRIQEKVHWITSRDTVFSVVGYDLCLWCTRWGIADPNVRNFYEDLWVRCRRDGHVYDAEAGGNIGPEVLFRQWQTDFGTHYTHTRWIDTNDQPQLMLFNELYPGAGTIRYRERPPWFWTYDLAIEGNTRIHEGARRKGKTSLAIYNVVQAIQLFEQKLRDRKTSDLAYIHRRILGRDVDELGRAGIPKLGAYLSDEMRIVTNIDLRQSFPHKDRVDYITRSSEAILKITEAGMKEDVSTFFLAPLDEAGRWGDKFLGSSKQVRGLVGQLFPLLGKLNVSGIYMTQDLNDQLGSSGAIAKSAEVRIQKTERTEGLFTMPALGLKVQRVTEIPGIPEDWFTTRDLASNFIHDFNVTGALEAIATANKEAKDRGADMTYAETCRVLHVWVSKNRAVDEWLRAGRDIEMRTTIAARLQKGETPEKVARDMIEETGSEHSEYAGMLRIVKDVNRTMKAREKERQAAQVPKAEESPA